MSDLVERLRAKVSDANNFDGNLLKEWDAIRATCLNHRGSDLPRLMFEGQIENFTELMTEGADEIERLTNQLVCAIDILQSLFPLHRMVTDQHADKHDAVPIGWTIDLGTIRRASKFIIAQVSQSDDLQKD